MALPLPKPHPQDLDPACSNCGGGHVYGDVCDSCGLCQLCDEFAGDDCYCEHPTASERFQAALEASL